MHATSDLTVVKHYSLLSLIAIAILEDGPEELGRYMSEAGYTDERHQIESVLSVSIQEDEPKLIVKFKFHDEAFAAHEDGAFFIWIREDESVGGDF